MGSFFHHPDGFVMINDERFSLDVFKIVDPSYALPSGANSRRYRQGEFHWITYINKKSTGPNPWMAGDIYIGRLNDFLAAREEDERETKEAKEDAKIAKFEALPASEKRKLRYPTQGELLEALWKKVVLGKSLEDSGCAALQIQRNKVDAQYPDS